MTSIVFGEITVRKEIKKPMRITAEIIFYKYRQPAIKEYESRINRYKKSFPSFIKEISLGAGEKIDQKTINIIDQILKIIDISESDKIRIFKIESFTTTTIIVLFLKEIGG